MLIDIPVTITFDHDTTWRSGPRANARVFTLRYDTEDGDKPAQFQTVYPPNPTGTWSTDKDGVLFAFFSSELDKAIAARAKDDPETYTPKAA